MKVVINRCFGGFGLSDKAYARLIELGFPVSGSYENEDPDGRFIHDSELDPTDTLYHKHKNNPSGLTRRYYSSWINKRSLESRSDKQIIQVVEELGAEANGPFGKLSIVEIPDGVSVEIDAYDGIESIEEVHRSW